MAAPIKKRNELLKITPRDAIIISLIMVFLEGYLLYTYLLVPSIQHRDELSRMLIIKNNQMRMLKQDYDQRTSYEQQIADSKTHMAELEKTVPAYLSEEEILMTLTGYAGSGSVDINSVSFTTGQVESAIPYLNGATESDVQAGASQGGTGTSGSATATAATVAVSDSGTAASGMTVTNSDGTVIDISAGYVRHMQFNVNATGFYGDVWAFLQNIERNERLIRVKGVTFVSEEGLVDATFQMETVSFTDGESTGGYDLDTGTTERDNPFRPYNGYLGGVVAGDTAVEQKTLEPSYYLILNSHLDNAAKVSMGIYSDPASDIAVNNNGVAAASLRISGTSDAITSVLKVGDKTYTAKGALSVVNDEMLMKVVSEARVSQWDKVGVELDVVNDTAYKLKIQVSSDDEARPRFTLGTTAGSVEIVEDR